MCGLIATLCACGGSTTRETGSVGTGVGVALSTADNTVTLNAGGSLVITATVSSDTNNAGVTWTLTGAGSLSSASTTAVTYNAPASVTGAAVPVITATSVADSTQLAAVQLVVNGSPVLSVSPLFPGNVGTAYTVPLNIAGGTSPFTWSVVSGSTLPAGLSLSTSTAASNTVTGTPTATGTSGFDIQISDSATPARTSSAHVDVTINPAAACGLNGRFAVLYSGVAGGTHATRAASLNVVNGVISGVLDQKEGSVTRTESALTGTCTNANANAGVLQLTGANDSPQLSYAINIGLNRGRLQLLTGGDSALGSGLFEAQTSSAFNLGALTGPFAFGLLGGEASGRSMGLIGRLNIAADGTLLGSADANGSTTINNAVLTGTLGAPDIQTGRGTLSLSAGGQNFSLVYYVIGANRLFVVNADTSAGAPRLAGFMTRQVGAFNSGALLAPALLSTWATANRGTPSANVTLGRFSGANTTAQTINLAYDNFNLQSNALAQSLSGGSYAVSATGRATVSFGAGARSYTAYLDGPSNGYLIENSSAQGAAGLLEAQGALPATGSLNGLLLLATQFPQTGGPVVTVPQAALVNGGLSAGSGQGSFNIDAATGRGFGNLQISGAFAANSVIYLRSPDRALVMSTGGTGSNATILWLEN